MCTIWTIRTLTIVLVWTVVTTLVPAIGAPREPCALFREIADADNARLGSPEAIAFSNLRSKKYRAIAQELFELYHKEGHESVAKAMACIPSRHLSGFLAAFDQTWYESSLERLWKYGGPLRKTVEQLAQSDRPAFRVLGVGGRPYGTRSASFHHGSNSIDLDLSRTQPNDWDWRFLHEIAHVLDGILTDAHEKNRTYLRTSSSEGQEQRPPHRPEDALESSFNVKEYVTTQLDLAFVAEYRAWAFVAIQYTFATQCAGAKSSALMEQLLEDETTTSIQGKIFRFLDSRFSSRAIPKITINRKLLAEIDHQMEAFRAYLPSLPNQFLQILEMNGSRRSDGTYVSSGLGCRGR